VAGEFGPTRSTPQLPAEEDSSKPASLGCAGELAYSRTIDFSSFFLSFGRLSHHIITPVRCKQNPTPVLKMPGSNCLTVGRVGNLGDKDSRLKDS
jgi:hypothetical protein